MVKRLSSFALAIGLLAATGCVDPKGAFDDFAGRVIDAAPPIDAAVCNDLPDINGQFLFGFASTINPETPLQFIANVTLTENGDGTSSMAMSLQPLVLEAPARPEDPPLRTPIGDLIASPPPVKISETCQATLVYERKTVPGRANPLTYSQATATLEVQVEIRTADLFCGPVNGDVVAPTMISVDGSNFGAIRITPGTIGDAALPQPVSRCPASMPADAGPGDAGPADAAPIDASAFR
jgi:hypothetical protein